jgi:predicted dehydrogenase
MTAARIHRALPCDDHDRTAEIDFVNAIRGADAGTLTGVATGFRSMAAVDAIDRAAATGQRMDVQTA